MLGKGAIATSGGGGGGPTDFNGIANSKSWDWRFKNDDATSSTTIVDETGNTAGTVVFGTFTSTTGVVQDGGTAKATNSIYTIDNSLGWGSGQTKHAGYIFIRSSNSGLSNRPIIDGSSGGGSTPIFIVQSINNIDVIINTTVDGDQTISVTSIGADNASHMIMWDVDLTAGTFSVWGDNGALIQTISGLSGTLTTSTNKVAIGGYDSSPAYYPGAIDDLAAGVGVTVDGTYATSLWNASGL